MHPDITRDPLDQAQPHAHMSRTEVLLRRSATPSSDNDPVLRGVAVEPEAGEGFPSACSII